MKKLSFALTLLILILPLSLSAQSVSQWDETINNVGKDHDISWKFTALGPPITYPLVEWGVTTSCYIHYWYTHPLFDSTKEWMQTVLQHSYPGPVAPNWVHAEKSVTILPWEFVTEKPPSPFGWTMRMRYNITTVMYWFPPGQSSKSHADTWNSHEYWHAF